MKELAEKLIQEGYLKTPRIIEAFLKAELKVGGRIVMPIAHSIWLYIKKSDMAFEKYEHHGFSFVPLIEDVR